MLAPGALVHMLYFPDPDLFQLLADTAQLSHFMWVFHVVKQHQLPTTFIRGVAT